MYKRFLFLFLIVFPCLLSAQGFNAGLRVGVVGSQVDGDTYEGFNKAGITAGLFVNRKLSDLFSLQLEMNYIQKGSRKPLDDNNTYYLMRVTYIEVPVLLQWHAGKLTLKKMKLPPGLEFLTNFPKSGVSTGVIQVPLLLSVLRLLHILRFLKKVSTIG